MRQIRSELAQSIPSERVTLIQYPSGLIDQTKIQGRIFIVLLFSIITAMTILASPVRASDKQYLIVQGSGDPQLEFCKQILREAFGRIGKKVKVVQAPAERAITMASEGEVDGDCLRVKGIVVNYPNLVQVPEHLHDVSFTAFSTKVTALPDGWMSLEPYSVAVPSGWKLIEQRVEEISPKQVLSVADTKALFQVLALERVDIGISNLVAIRKHVEEHGNDEGVRPIMPPLEQVPLFLTLNISNSSLVEPLANAIAELKRDGIWSQIHDDVLSPFPID